MSEIGLLGALKNAKSGFDQRSSRLDELRMRSQEVILSDLSETFGGQARTTEVSFFQHLSTDMERQLSWGTGSIEGRIPFRFSGRRAPLDRTSGEANVGSIGYQLDVSKEKLQLRLNFDEVTRRMLGEPQAPEALGSALEAPYDRRGETESRRFAAAIAMYFGVSNEKLVKPELSSELGKELLLKSVARQVALSFGSPPGPATAEFVPGAHPHILVTLETPGVKAILSRPRVQGGADTIHRTSADLKAPAPGATR